MKNSKQRNALREIHYEYSLRDDMVLDVITPERETSGRGGGVVGLMLKRMTDIAKEAFASHNYDLAVEMYERNLKHQTPSLDMLIGYGDSLARCGRIRDSIDVFARCLTLAPLPPERLKNLANALLRELTSTMISSRHDETSFSCPTCEGTLYQPVTAGCGHTHCKKCYESAKCCRACGQKLGPIGETNVLVQRLVEKWWPREAEASRARHEGDAFLKDGHLTQALEHYNLAVRL
ncbi:hypothetical protein PV326_006003, partial [Microctonus aethiopoides]